MNGPRMLVVRLGAMGDIIHALPAAATLKHSFPGSYVAWLVEPKWAALLEGNPFLDEVLLLDRSSLGGLWRTRRQLAARRFVCAVDFQGLLKSALCCAAARPERIYGFHRSQLREGVAALFYSHAFQAGAAHVVDRNLELAAAAGATNPLYSFPLPPGRPEGELPEGDFVLASPLAGWVSKQWPLENYLALGRLLWRKLGCRLVLDFPPGAKTAAGEGIVTHVSGLAGLIHATRQAAAVVGVDSGPLHLAAALGRPGVAIFGPTDPARNGPYGGSIRVLRDPSAVTSYKRRTVADPAMLRIGVDAVFEALRTLMRSGWKQAGCGG